MKNYLAQNLNFVELGAPFRGEIRNFIKSESFDGFFPNSISDVLERFFIKNYLDRSLKICVS